MIQDNGKEKHEERKPIDERYDELECSAKKETKTAAIKQKAVTTKSKDSSKKKGPSREKTSNNSRRCARGSKSASGSRTSAKRKEAIQQILEKFRGTKNTSQMKPARKKTLILKTKNEKGKMVTFSERNVFGDSHNKLHDEEREMTMESMITAETKRTKDGEDKRTRTREMRFWSSQK